MKYKWHKKVLEKEYRNTKYQSIFLVIFFAVTMVWNHFVGQPLEWRWVEIVLQPSIPYRLLYGALAYVTLGAFLYKMGFYKSLCNFVFGVLGSYQLYVGIKKIYGLRYLL